MWIENFLTCKENKWTKISRKTFRVMGKYRFNAKKLIWTKNEIKINANVNVETTCMLMKLFMESWYMCSWMWWRFRHFEKSFSGDLIPTCKDKTLDDTTKLINNSSSSKNLYCFFLLLFLPIAIFVCITLKDM